ncbi:MAG: hypothetical protein KDE29_10405 [Anaerolineales bacterium]|nr:hypothetical protein [Anaerolineales bacterium]
MMSQVHLLYRLQQIDSEIISKKQRLTEVLRAQRDNAALLAARQQAADAAQLLQKRRALQKALELELAGVNSKAKRSEDRLYSGNVKNPKELADLQHEIEALGRRRSALEDEILEAMLLVEEAAAADAASEAARQQQEATWADRLASLQAEQHTLAVRLNELLEARPAQVARIDPPMMEIYQSTGRAHHGVAVAALKGAVCQACGVSTSANKMRMVEVGEVAYCGSCGRILCAV